MHHYAVLYSVQPLNILKLNPDSQTGNIGRGILLRTSEDVKFHEAIVSTSGPGLNSTNEYVAI